MSVKICFTMDNLSDAADLGRGVIDKPRPPGQRPALEQGFPAMLDLFERFDVKITHFLEGWNGVHHPDIVADILQRGHSIGMHGWMHERWSGLSPDQENELAARATEALRQAGASPTAFRAPGGRRSSHTVDILTELGYCIDASQDEAGSDGGDISRLGPGLWNIPYYRAAVDASHWLWNDTDPAVVEKLWLQMLEQQPAEQGFLVFIWHPHVMGIDKQRLQAGASILEKVKSDDRFLVCNLDQLLAADGNAA